MNIADEIDAINRERAEPNTELARARLALAEAARLNAEVFEALESLVGACAEAGWPISAEHLTPMATARAVLEKVRQK